MSNKAQFVSQAPLLYIYPFFSQDQAIINALTDLAGYNLCDILYLTRWLSRSMSAYRRGI